MLTAEERERFETVLLKAHRCLSYSMEALVLLDALEALPEERRVPHLAYLLQNFWNYPDVKNEEINRTKPSWEKRYLKMANALTEQLAARLNPFGSTHPSVEELALEIWTVLSSYQRPQRDVALSIIVQSLVPYDRVPEPNEFALTHEEFAVLQRADKPMHATAHAIASATADPSYPRGYAYFVGAILSLITGRPPKEQSALLTTFLKQLDCIQTQLREDAEEPPPKSQPPPTGPSGKPN